MYCTTLDYKYSGYILQSYSTLLTAFHNAGPTRSAAILLRILKGLSGTICQPCLGTYTVLYPF